MSVANPPPTPVFAERDPLIPAFWDARFAQRFTPWDQGSVPGELADFVAQRGSDRCLIPGCGVGHEVRAMVDAGWQVTAIDFSAEAVAAAQQQLGGLAQHVQQADFFAFAPPAPLDIIYERAFLCALPRAHWPAVAARWASLLPAGAELVGYFYFDTNPNGPPFGIERTQLAALMQGAFELVEDRPARDSIAVFAGKERWMRWRRREVE